VSLFLHNLKEAVSEGKNREKGVSNDDAADEEVEEKVDRVETAEDNNSGTKNMMMIVEAALSASGFISPVQRARTGNDENADDHETIRGVSEHSKVNNSQSQEGSSFDDTEKIHVESVPGNFTKRSKMLLTLT
jgi:hypothetical protein